MSHELEVITTNGILTASFAFSGERKDIWHRLGQQFEGAALMTADEAMRRARMDRAVYVVKAEAPAGARFAEGIEQAYVMLDGIDGLDDAGNYVRLMEPKVVGLAGNQAAQAHAQLTVKDRFDLAEAAIHVSQGKAVWSTAGYLRDGTQGFACMEAPPIIIDPNGAADVVRSYLTLQWSYNGTIPGGGLLGASNVRVLCANTQAMHNQAATTLIKVKATSGVEERFALAAKHWGMAQDEAKALALQGERMMAVKNGKQVLKGLCENVLGLKITADASKRERTLRENKIDEVRAIFHGPTNLQAVGDNGYAAFQAVVEYLDWFSPVKGDNPDTQRVANQFDGTYDAMKAKAADYVLALAN